MKTIHYALGLPRSGSTLLMNILQQNPDIFTSSTCPTTYIIEGIRQTASNVPEFIAMEQDALNNCFTNYIVNGMNGWFSSMTEKPIVFSKSRGWSFHLNFLFHAYENPKFLVIIRDLRDIICSFEKLMFNYNIWTMGSREEPFHTLSFDKRIEIWCTDMNGNLGLPLKHLTHVYEWINKKPNNFYVCRFEDFCKNPNLTLDSIYNWLELPKFQHDLFNIDQAKQYEHDSAYRAYVSHKTSKEFKNIGSSWHGMMTDNQSKTVIENNKWFYQTFYPKIYYDYINN